MDLHAPMAKGCSVWFAQPDALKGSLVKTLRDVRPTIFVGVPRVRMFFAVARGNVPSFYTRRETVYTCTQLSIFGVLSRAFARQYQRVPRTSVFRQEEQ